MKKQINHANIVIPIDPNSLANRDTLRKSSERGRETYKIKVADIEVRAGHNARSEYNEGFTDESLLELGSSIAELGLQHPIGIDFLSSGKGVLQYGERRLKAHQLMQGLKEEGKYPEGLKDYDFSTIECFIMPKGYSEQDRTLAMLIENQQVELTELEEAEACARLVAEGMTAAEISKRVPKWNPMRVSLRLALSRLTEFEKEMIRKGEISTTAAVELSKQKPDTAERLAYLKDQYGKGEKVKVTDVKGMKEEKPDELPVTPAEENTNTVYSAPEDKEENSGFDLHDDEDGSDDDEQGVRGPEDGDRVETDIADEKSLKGTSPKASEFTPKDDAAVKSADSPDANISDAKLLSGKATAFDMVLKSLDLFKNLQDEMEGKATPKAETIMYDIDRILYDLKAILKKW